MTIFDYLRFCHSLHRILMSAEVDGKDIYLVDSTNYYIKPFAVYSWDGTCVDDGQSGVAPEFCQISPRYVRKSVAIKAFNRIVTKTA